MEFEFDPFKDDRIRSARGFGIADAVEIFAGPVIEHQDMRRDYGEVRIVATGQARGIFYTIVYTDRGPVRHIVTAWLASRKARKTWLASV